MRNAGILTVVLCLQVSTGASGEADSLYGKPEVMEFKDGKIAAFSMQFDDSMDTHAKFVIPELNKRDMVGTFFINPGLERYQRNKEVWEVICPKYGHELANHTMHHRGAKDPKELDYEVGECARLIWRLYPNKSKIRPFLRGGGANVKWDFSREEVREVMHKYCLFWGVWPTPRVSVSEERGSGRAVVLAEKALKERKWIQVGFHGVGGEWISTSAEHFIELLDYLVANRDSICINTTGDLHRYSQEYQAIKAVELTDASETGFRLAIECDENKVETYGRSFAELYDEPLTVRVEVPDNWSHFTVTQMESRKSYDVIEVDEKRYAQFDVCPNFGSAVAARQNP